MHHVRPYRPVQPLTGLRETRAAAVPYRALAPGGAGRSYGISSTRIIPQTPTDYYSLFTDHSEVYCADNPVKLVDPDGRQWESKADEEKALSLIEQAQDNQKTIYASIKMITSKKELSRRDKAMLNDLISQYQYLSEGIANLNDMGSSTEETFHFSNLPSIDEGCVHKRQDGVIDIIHSSDAMAWHECVHFGDYKKNLNWNFDKNGYLATAPDNYAASEYKAYESQFSFDNNSLKYSNGTTVQSISQVKIWVKFHGYDVK